MHVFRLRLGDLGINPEVISENQRILKKPLDNRYHPVVKTIDLFSSKGGDDVDMDMRDPGDMCRTMRELDQPSWKRPWIGAREAMGSLGHIIIPSLTVP